MRSDCVLRDGQVLATAQQERFSQREHDAGSSAEAIVYCLAEAGTNLTNVEHIVFYDKPLIKFERLLETYLSYAPNGFWLFVPAMPDFWARLICQMKVSF